MQHEFTFNYINEQLLNAGAVNSAAELHGFMCAAVASGQRVGKPNQASYLNDQLRFMGIEAEKITGEGGDALSSMLFFMQQETFKRFCADDLSFKLLIPTDETALLRRTQEVGAWCEGFLHGFASSGVNHDAQLNPDIADGLRDLASIAQVDVKESDDSERHLVEVIEYIKVVALMFYQEFVLKESGGASNMSTINADNLH